MQASWPTTGTRRREPEVAFAIGSGVPFAMLQGLQHPFLWSLLLDMMRSFEKRDNRGARPKAIVMEAATTKQ